MAGSAVDAEAINAFEAAGWGATAGGYDDFFGQIVLRPVERLLDAAQIDRGVRMLDGACGPEYAAGRAAERGAVVIGVDVADAMVALARRRFAQLEFRRMKKPARRRRHEAAAGALWLLLRYQCALWERADRVPPSGSAPNPNQAVRHETEGSG